MANDADSLRRGRKPMKILLAVDGSAYTKRMLDYLGAHEELFGADAKYTAMTVIAAVAPHVTRFIDDEALAGYYEDQALEALKPVRAFATRHKRDIKTLYRIGQAADVIAKTATTGRFDLLMMGSHGRSGVQGLLLGSVSSRVMASCAMPTLIIR